MIWTFGEHAFYEWGEFPREVKLIKSAFGMFFDAGMIISLENS